MAVGDKLLEAENGDNMELWNSNCKTDKKYTSQMPFGAKLTAIDATYQKRRATQRWGPYGQTWGLRDLKWGYVGPAEQPLELWLEATFWYPGGKFELASDIAYKKGDDCRKKLQTDVVKKALAYLGFSADIYLGKFEDDRYVSGTIDDHASLVVQITTALKSCKDAATLDRYMAKARMMGLNRERSSTVEKAYSARLAELASNATDKQAEEVF